MPCGHPEVIEKTRTTNAFHYSVRLRLGKVVQPLKDSYPEGVMGYFLETS